MTCLSGGDLGDQIFGMMATTTWTAADRSDSLNGEDGDDVMDGGTEFDECNGGAGTGDVALGILRRSNRSALMHGTPVPKTGLGDAHNHFTTGRGGSVVTVEAKIAIARIGGAWST